MGWEESSSAREARMRVMVGGGFGARMVGKVKEVSKDSAETKGSMDGEERDETRRWTEGVEEGRGRGRPRR